MPKAKYTKKDRESVYKVAIDILRNKHHKEYVALRSKFTQEERNLVGEIMNGPVSKYHSHEAIEAYRRVVLTEHKIFGVKEVVVQNAPLYPETLYPETKTEFTFNAKALYGESVFQNPRVKKIIEDTNKRYKRVMKKGILGLATYPGNVTSTGKPVTVTAKDIRKAVKKIKKWNTYKKMLETVAFIERPREFWLSDQFFKFTREEIDSADTSSGYIGMKAGIKCYIKK